MQPNRHSQALVPKNGFDVYSGPGTRGSGSSEREPKAGTPDNRSRRGASRKRKKVRRPMVACRMQCDAKHDRRHLTGTGLTDVRLVLMCSFTGRITRTGLYLLIFLSPSSLASHHLVQRLVVPCICRRMDGTRAPSPLDGSARWRHLSDRAGVWGRCGRPGWLIWIRGGSWWG